MSFTDYWLRETVTHWARSGYDSYGKPTFSAPTEVRGAWEQKIELVRTIDGSEKMSQARVFLSADVEEGDFIYLGATPSGASDPTTVEGAYRVLAFGKTKDVLNNRYERIAHL